MKTNKIIIGIIQMMLILNALTIIALSDEADDEPSWPSSWILIDSDPDENGPNGDYRDVKYAYFNQDEYYLYFRLECYSAPNFTSEPDSRYKWFIDTDDPHNMVPSGGNVYGTDYVLFVEESQKTGDGIGDIYLLPDKNDDGVIDGDWPNYMEDPGSITDINISGYRIEGNCIDLYIRLENISNPYCSYFTWATDQGDPNVDSAPTLDRSNKYWDSDLSKADISIDKSDSKDPVIPGESFNYTLTVTNHGPHIAYNITVIDTLPGNIELNNANPAETSGSFPIFTWDIDTLAVGESYIISLNVTVDSDFIGILSNSAQAVNYTYDPYPPNNIASENTTVQAIADLGITKSDNAIDPVYPEDIFTYNLNVTNYGPFNAENVVVTDILPSGIIFSNAIPAPSSIDGSTLTWDYSLIESEETFEILVNVIVDNVASEVILNTAQITSETLDLDLNNNNASEETLIGSSVDLEIVKTDNIDPVYTADIFTYNIHVANHGPETAIGINVTDTLPSGVSFINSTPMPDGNSGSVYWWDIASIEKNGFVDIYINVLVDDSKYGTVTNIAQVSCDTFDFNSTNDIASEDTLIINTADLAVSKSDSADPSVYGDNLTYTIIVTNNGPGTAEDIVITDTLPQEVTFLSSDPAPFDIDDQTYKWNKATLAAYESYVITINVSINNDTTGIITNNVQVSSETYDTNLENNEYTEDTKILGIADLSIEKTSDVTGKIYEGDIISYTINVTNHGPDTAYNVNVTDTLPDSVTFDNSTPLPDGFNESKYWWNIPEIEFNESKLIIINVTINQGFSGVITNIATVDEESHDPDDENNQDDDNTTVDKEEPPIGGDGDGDGDGDGAGGGDGDSDPTADADGPYYGVPGEQIQFNGSASHDNDEDGVSIVRFDWKFTKEQEWQIDQGPNPTYVYLEEGTYNVTLRVIDDEESSDIYKTQAIIIKPNTPPSIPEFIGPQNVTVNVSNSYIVVSSDEDGGNIKYIIDWGDNTTSDSEFIPSGVPFEINHTWLKIGSYNVTVSADDGKTISTNKIIINVNPEPKPKEQGISLWWLALLGLLILLLLLILEKRRRDKKEEQAPPKKQ